VSLPGLQSPPIHCLAVKRFLSAILLCCSLAASAALANGLQPRAGVGTSAGAAAPSRAATKARAAVARIVSPDQTGVSYGSGVLVAVRGTCALVLTNWHVIRETAGPVQVVFPDGFRSAATVLATDRDWDLAALAIWRPRAEPVALAVRPPRPGEALTIAGYGRGWYRESTGPCTQYLSPGVDLPFDLVELAAPARQGDSGGPIFNQRGELAGVLFGSSFGRTTGSHCARVRWFLDRAWPNFQELADQRAMIAQGHQTPQSPVASIRGVAAGVSPSQTASGPMSRELGGEQPGEQPAAGWAHGQAVETQAGRWLPGEGLVSAASEAAPEAASPAENAPQKGGASSSGAHQGPLPARLEQIKTLLAIVGGVTLLVGGLRLLGLAAG